MTLSASYATAVLAKVIRKCTPRAHPAKATRRPCQGWDRGTPQYAGKATNDLNELQVAFRSLAADALPAFLNDIQVWRLARFDPPSYIDPCRLTCVRALAGWPPRGRSLAVAGGRGPPAPAEAVHAPRGRNRAPANEQRTQPASRMRLWAVLFRWHARGWAAAAFISGLSRIVGMRGGGAAAAPWSLSVQVIFFLQKLVIYRSAVENLMRTTNTVALGPEPTGAPGRGNAVPEHPVSRLAQYIGAVCRNVLLPHTGAGADFSAPRRRHALPRGPGYQWLPSAT